MVQYTQVLARYINDPLYVVKPLVMECNLLGMLNKSLECVSVAEIFAQLVDL